MGAGNGVCTGSGGSSSRGPVFKSDPFAPESDVSERLAVPSARADQKRIALCLRLETWEGTALEVARWQDGVRKGSSFEQVRESFLSGKAAAQLLFSPSIAIDQATAASAESISEWIYPTEYEPPVNPGSQPSKQEVPKVDGEWKNRLAAVGDHAVPTSFETRNAGQTLEATVQAVTAGESCWDVSMNFEDIASLGTLSYGAKHSMDSSRRNDHSPRAAAACSST